MKYLGTINEVFNYKMIFTFFVLTCIFESDTSQASFGSCHKVMQMVENV